MHRTPNMIDLRNRRRARSAGAALASAACLLLASRPVLARVRESPPSAATAGASGAPATPASAPAPSLLTRRNLLYAALSAGALIGTAANDLALRTEAVESRSRGEDRLAQIAQPFGNVAVVAPALAAAWCGARLARSPGLEGAIDRVAFSVGAAGASSLLLKEVAGRPRPYQSPTDSDDLLPFSGHDSFPSGHAAVAFALAGAISRESPARWVPWVAYPVAALVGWSRVHDDRHWASDVVAGAGIGFWAARKVESRLRLR